MTVTVEINLTVNDTDEYNRKITTFTNVLSEVYNNENDLINYFDTLQDDVNEDEELQEKINFFSNDYIEIRGDLLGLIVNKFKLKLNLAPYEELNEETWFTIEVND